VTHECDGKWTGVLEPVSLSVLGRVLPSTRVELVEAMALDPVSALRSEQVSLLATANGRHALEELEPRARGGRRRRRLACEQSPDQRTHSGSRGLGLREVLDGRTQRSLRTRHRHDVPTHVEGRRGRSLRGRTDCIGARLKRIDHALSRRCAPDARVRCSTATGHAARKGLAGRRSREDGRRRGSHAPEDGAAGLWPKDCASVALAIIPHHYPLASWRLSSASSAMCPLSAFI